MVAVLWNLKTGPLNMAQIDPNTIQWDAPPQPVGEPVTGSIDKPLRGGVIIRAKPEKPREAPSGYRYSDGGNLEIIPGGPADPEVKQDTKPSESQNKIFQLLTRISGGANDIQNALAIDSEAQQGGFFETISRSTLGEGMITRGISGENRRIVTDSQANILDALLTLGTGAAYNEEQKVANSVAYFPQYGDSDREIIIKNERLNQAIAAARIAAGPLAEDFDKSIQPLMNTIDGNVEKPPSKQLSADIRVAEGKTYSTDEDFKRRRDSAEQWSATQGLPFDQALVKFNAAMQAKGYTAAGADTIEALRRYEETNPVIEVQPSGASLPPEPGKKVGNLVLLARLLPVIRLAQPML